MENESVAQFQVVFMSFGFKYGVPGEANMVFDARFLPNPYWVDDLRSRSGQDQQVAEYVLGSEEGKEFLRVLVPLLRFLIEQNRRASKKDMRIAIGCTGGHHRSVAVVEALASILTQPGLALSVWHRDLAKPL